MNQPMPANEASPAGASRLKRVLKGLLIGCAVGLPLWALSRNWGEVVDATRKANGWMVAAVGLGLVAYTILNAAVWTDVLHALGWRGGRLLATRTWIESEAMKWLPGGVWGYASRVVKAPAIGIPRAVAGASLVAELLLTILAWAVLAGLGLALDGEIFARLRGQLPAGITDGSAPLLLGLGGLLAVLALSGLALLAPLRRAVMRRLEPLRIGGWRFRPLVRAASSYFVLCLFHAFLLSLLVNAFHPGDFGWGPAAAADGSSWLIGFFAIGVPGGIGVREAGIAWFLGTHVPLADAMAVAVVWRALQVGAELAALAASHAIGRRARVVVGLDGPVAKWVDPAR